MTVDSQTTTVAPTGGEAAESAVAPQTGPVTPEAAQAAEPGVDPEKGRKAAHLLRVLRDRQLENARRNADPAAGAEAQEGEAGESAPGAPEAARSDGAEEGRPEHPALRGLPRDVDEEGKELVQFQGAWVAPEFVIDLYEQGQRLTAAAEPAKESADVEDAEWQAEQQRLLGEFEQAAVDLLADTRQRAFPGLSEEQGALLDELLLPYADRLFARMDWEGLDEEGLLGRFDTAGRELMGRVRDLFTLAAAQQLADNAEYAAAHRAAPDGPPGTPLPEGADMESYLRLPGAKRRDITRRAAEVANTLHTEK